MPKHMTFTSKVALPGNALSEESVRQTLHSALAGSFRGRRVLVLIPDFARSLPLPFLFRILVDLLGDARQVDFLVALGTHPPLSQEQLCRLVGITAGERQGIYVRLGLANHDWANPAALETLGVITGDEVRALAGDCWHPSLSGDVDVRVNRALLECDHVLIVSPVVPHEVAGFSGGAKYLFPGVSGPQMINVAHWLGALAGIPATIGVKDTPVRALTHSAAALLPVAVTLLALVTGGEELAGIFIGDLISAWSAAADLSAQLHIRRCEHAYRRVLSCPGPRYNELWTAAKAMYKLEPVLSLGAEIVIYAPHLNTVSQTHGKYIYEIGYHILPYFLDQWDRFRNIPPVVLAHSTHLRGSGRMENGAERPNVGVTLASGISAEDCARLNLGYLDPASVRPGEWKNREDEGILYVPDAGEILYRLQ
jgi:nickel-dependent lactate racemase